MKLATLRIDGSTRAAALADGSAVLLDASCVGELLAQEGWRERADAALAALDPDRLDPERLVPESAWALAPLIPRPGKIFCVGLNYAAHIDEMGHERPDVPTLFAKFADALAGPRDDLIVHADAAGALDYEGELAVVIGETAYRVDEDEAASRIAGYAILDDFTQRDAQYATQQWLQGKTLQRTSAFGPWLATPDEFDAATARVRTWVDGELRQDAPIADLVFPPAALVAYVSRFVQLNPGDVISTGTPAGVGHGMKPKTYLGDGQEIRVAIDGLGEQRNILRIR
ncbi:fumarylacetoacetate hydrolase family protein [Corynebacterium freneyi]|uniref:2-hydroxyhepta-2,4-diene-1,7-dioate isomerase n=1 Tax=Corynebacterium freneyi DNF00450 TaxID=1287475 RepID=A0A096A8B5_9CORY|nr:fumarylacetoacetate hydrolase family protein [Corynebacterium freneyi]KGF17131.1 2-hydroxyhepta-2,4-diene-1,7-dioate isomerase [Corynebacterium freneyi DNF00450]KGF17134.1 2-hydroxyhepta-2,4-diene-1,7-dioate isomerase [Corynebacterium freneyi DNF00450]